MAEKREPERQTIENLEYFRCLPLAERRAYAIAALEYLACTTFEEIEGALRASLSQCRISDAEMEYFSALPEIEEIDLFETTITGEGLWHLSGLKSLRRLWFYRFPVSEKDRLIDIHFEFVRNTNSGFPPGQPNDGSPSFAGMESLSWCYDGSFDQRHFDFAWRLGETCYLMRCSGPIIRFPEIEPVFLRMAKSFKINTDDRPPE